jgi:hypothetical protein
VLLILGSTITRGLCIRLTRGSPVPRHAHPARVDEDAAVGVLIADECVSPIQRVSLIQCDHSSRPLVMAAVVCDGRLGGGHVRGLATPS